MPSRPREAIGFWDKLATEAAADFLGEVMPGLAMIGGAWSCWAKAEAVEAGKPEVDELEPFKPLSLSSTVLRLFLLTLWIPLELAVLGFEAIEGLSKLEVGLGAILGNVLPAIWWVEMGLELLTIEVGIAKVF